MTLLSPLLSTTENLYGQLLKKMPNQKTTALQLLIRERGLGA